MLKPWGKEGDVSLKSNPDGEKQGMMYVNAVAILNIC